MPSKFSSAFSKLSDQIREMGRSARRDIDAIRHEIATAQDDLRQIELAPVDDAEVLRRAKYTVENAAAAARSGGGFTLFTRPGGFDENRAAIFVERIPAFDLFAIVQPDTLVAALVAEAKASSADYSRRGPVTDGQRETEARAARKRIEALSAREELAVRALGEAGIIIERRAGVDEGVAAADVAGLESLAG